MIVKKLADEFLAVPIADLSPEKRWNFTIGDGGFVLLAGPCSLETPELGLEIAETVRDI